MYHMKCGYKHSIKYIHNINHIHIIAHTHMKPKQQVIHLLYCFIIIYICKVQKSDLHKNDIPIVNFSHLLSLSQPLLKIWMHLFTFLIGISFFCVQLYFCFEHIYIHVDVQDFYHFSTFILILAFSFMDYW